MGIGRSGISTGGGLIGGAGVTTGGAYGAHRVTGVTIEELDSVGGRIHARNYSDEDWKLLEKKLKANSSKNENYELDYTGVQSVETGLYLKNWCNKAKGWYFSSLLISRRDALKKYVEGYCILTIGEKLGTYLKADVTNDDENKAIFKTLFQQLKSHSDTDNGNIDNNKELKKVKDDNTNDEDAGGKALKSWCSSIYPRIYVSENDDTYKLAKKYCTSNASTATAQS